jgi:CSLREA domain-containing protein
LRFEPLEDRRMLSITVTTTADVVDLNDGVTSLREAIYAANTVPGADTIEFDPALTASGPVTILLTQGELTITDALTISGPGADQLTIDAQQQSRIFDIEAATGDFTISGLTLTHGAITANGSGIRDPAVSGGAVLSNTPGQLTLDHMIVTASAVSGTGGVGGGVFASYLNVVDSSFTDNSAASLWAGGIYASSLTLTRTTVSGNGGDGAFAPSITANGCMISGNMGSGLDGERVTVSDCQILNNVSPGSGHDSGISAGQTVSVERCTISGNSGSLIGGGGIYCHGAVTVADSTISGNSTGGVGGAIDAKGTITLTNSHLMQNTASSRGGAVYAGSTNDVNVTNCVISGNKAVGMVGVLATGGGLMSGGNVTLTDSDVSSNSAKWQGGGIYCASITVEHSTISDNSGATGGGIYAHGKVDMSQSTISGNHALGDGSGSAKSGNGAGVFTLFSLSATDSMILNNTAGGGQGGGVYVVFGGTLSGCTISGNGTTGTTSRLGGGGVCAPLSPYGLTITNCTISDNSTTGVGASGGGVAAGTLTVTDSTITHNTTKGKNAGGGGLVASVSATMTNTVVSSNSTMGDYASGGGVAGAKSLVNCTISGNSTSGSHAVGGGVVGASLGMSFVNCTITNNSTSGSHAGGGGVVAVGTISSSTISGNRTTGDFSPGGGVAGGNDVLTITNSTITGNTTAGVHAAGGGVIGDVVHVYGGSVISDNHTTGKYSPGGGVQVGFSTVIKYSAIRDNSTAGFGAYGGGIYGTGTMTITGSTVSGNSTALAVGGGLATGARLTVTSSTISGNTSGGGGGGGVYAGGSGVTFTNTTFSDNSAPNGYGGGVWSRYGSATRFIESTITSNHADRPTASGGGIYVQQGAPTFTSSIVAGNSAGHSPDVSSPTSPTLTFSLVGTNSGTILVEAPVGSPDANGNLIGGPVHGVIDPQLGALIYNGGPTFLDGSELLTRSPMVGSPVIDAGDPAAVAGVGSVPASDERGAPFTRVFSGRIDMGAIEVEPAGFLAGDYNRDGVVDAADYTRWRDTSGASVAAGTSADGNGDGKVDSLDYNVWKTNFGQVLPVAGSGAASEGANNQDARARSEGQVASALSAPGQQVAPTSTLSPSQLPTLNAQRSLRDLTLSSLASNSSHDTALLVWLSNPRPSQVDAEALAVWESSTPSRTDRKESTERPESTVDQVFESFDAPV